MKNIVYIVLSLADLEVEKTGATHFALCGKISVGGEIEMTRVQHFYLLYTILIGRLFGNISSYKQFSSVQCSVTLIMSCLSATLNHTVNHRAAAHSEPQRAVA